MKLNRTLLSVVGLFILFFWFYGRFAPQLYFIMDDYIETRYNLTKPLSAMLLDSFSGELNWSGYRPLTYAIRAIFSHWFRLDHVIGYHLYGLALHFVNTVLVLLISRRLFAHSAWALLAALIFLLLPSHNEAIFYMSANANLTGLCLALLSIRFVLMTQEGSTRLYSVLACLFYALAVLAYEVLLPLPLLLWLLEWRLNGKVFQRKQRWLYGGLLLVAIVLLGLRYWLMEQRLTPARADYAISTDWWHIGRGYLILWGQMVLLHTSAWQHYPLFRNARDWLHPLDSRALLSVGIIITALVGWLLLLRQKISRQANPPLFWLEWGIAWLYVFSLPFAMLSGRYPENRYVYIPSFGFAVGLAACFALLYGAVERRALLRTLVVALPIGLLIFYAYVTTSDRVEWVSASRHARTFITQSQALIQHFPLGSRLFQTDVPEHVGAAYIFTTDEAFRSAMQWVYADDQLDVTVGHLKLREYLRADDSDLTKSYLLAYDAAAYRTRLIDWVKDCYTEIDCTLYPLAPFTPPAKTQAQITFAEGIQLLTHEQSWLYHINYQKIEPVLITCWQLTTLTQYDYTFYLHLTDSTGATMFGQSDHRLRQGYPFSRALLTTSQWPVNEPVCDVAFLAEALANASGVGPVSLRGGLWIPETGATLPATSIQGYEVDPYGKIIFSKNTELLPP